jgi:hypothetical protein
VSGKLGILCYNLFMKKILFLLFILIPTLAWAQPSLEFKNEKHDFGTIGQGQQLEYAFEFTNTGSEELIIKRVNTS